MDHVHQFDRDGFEVAVREIDDADDVPTLGDVIKEARDDHYYAPTDDSAED